MRKWKASMAAIANSRKYVMPQLNTGLQLGWAIIVSSTLLAGCGSSSSEGNTPVDEKAPTVPDNPDTSNPDTEVTPQPEPIDPEATLSVTAKYYSSDELEERYTAVYNHKGQLLELAYDETGDGVTDESTWYEYDEYGNVLKETIDNTGDAVANKITQYTYLSFNKWLSRTIDSDADGQVDQVFLTEYNDNGDMTRFTRDDGNDDSLDYIVLSQYNEAGFLVKEETDSDGDGQANRSKWFTRDKAGNAAKEQVDSDGDGVINYTYHYEYNEQNLMTYRGFDQYNDNSLDQITQYEYNATGQFTRQVFDYNGDGIADKSIAFDYDDLQSIMKTDNNDNGSIDSIDTRTYNSAGKLLLLAKDTDGNGEANRVEECRYDANSGYITHYLLDSDNDGEIDQSLERFYNESNMLIEVLDNSDRRYDVQYAGESRIYELIDNHIIYEFIYDGICGSLNADFVK